MVNRSERPTRPPILHRMLLEVGLVLHIMLAGSYWWLAPKGFPIHHSRFWLNRVIPAVTLLLAVAGLVAIIRQRFKVLTLIVICLAAMWAGMSVSARIWFPVSFARLWWVGLLVAFIGLGCFHSLNRKYRVGARLWWLAGSAISAILGVAIMWSQLPPPPTTIPMDETVGRISTLKGE